VDALDFHHSNNNLAPHTMPSILDLSAELQLLVIGYLESPVTKCKAPAAYFAPRANVDIANLGSCCRTFRKLVAPFQYRRLRLRNNDKSGELLKAVGGCQSSASFVRELNVEGNTIIDDDESEDPVPLADEDFPSSVEEVLSHLDRFPKLETLTVQFKLGETEEDDEEGTRTGFNTWFSNVDPFRNTDELRRMEAKTGWRGLMARTYDAISKSERPSILTTLELRNLLPSGVSSFTTSEWQSFFGTLKTLRISLHAGDNGAGWEFNTAYGYIEFIENLDLFFSQLASITEFRFAATTSGLPGLSGQNHATIPLDAEHMPLLQVLEFQFCFISERIARFITSHITTLKRIALEDCYSAATDDLADEHTTWAAFFTIIADSLEAVENPPLEDFFVSPRVLGGSSEPGHFYEDLQIVPIDGDDVETELARKLSETDPSRRPFEYAHVDDKYGMLFEDEGHNLTAFLEGRDQAAYNRLMAIVGRRSGSMEWTQ
jgi:hypothetical protein